MEELHREGRPENPMGFEKEGKLLFRLGWPMILSMLSMALYNVVDSIFVSHIGEDALTAVSLAFPIQMLMISVAVGTAVGMNSLISRRLGEKRFAEAGSAADNGLMLLLLSSLVFVLFGIFAVKPFFTAYTDETAIRAYGIQYLSICCTCCVGVFLQTGAERIMQAQGKTVFVMLTQLIGAAVNLVLDPILIFGYFGFPVLGIRGAAIATVLGQIVAMLVCFLILASPRNEVRLHILGFRPSWTSIRDIYQVGLPSIVLQAMGTVMNLCMNAVLTSYSGTAVAVFGVYYKVQSLIFMPMFGLMGASMSIMAYNFGARSRVRLIRTWKITVLTLTGLMCLGCLMMVCFPDMLLGWFNASAEMLSIGRVAFRVLAPSFIPAAFCITNSNLFQAIGRGVYSMWVSLFRQLIALVPAAFLLSAIFHNVDAVWFSFIIAELVSVLCSVLLLRRAWREDIVPLEAAPINA